MKADNCRISEKHFLVPNGDQRTSKNDRINNIKYGVVGLTASK